MWANVCIMILIVHVHVLYQIVNNEWYCYYYIIAVPILSDIYDSHTRLKFI